MSRFHPSRGVLLLSLCLVASAQAAVSFIDFEIPGVGALRWVAFNEVVPQEPHEQLFSFIPAGVEENIFPGLAQGNDLVFVLDDGNPFTVTTQSLARDGDPVAVELTDESITFDYDFSAFTVEVSYTIQLPDSAIVAELSQSPHLQQTVTVTNETSDEIEVNVGNYFDFDLGDDPTNDLLSVFTQAYGMVFVQTTPESGLTVAVAGPNDAVTIAGTPVFVLDATRGGDLPTSRPVAPGSLPGNYALAFGSDLTLAAGASASLTYYFGIVAIPEPTHAALFCGLSGLLSLLLRRRR